MRAAGEGRLEGQTVAGPIFVVGGMRSGTTLLRLMLDSHPSISIGSETGFMGAAAAVKKIPGWRNGAEWYHRIGWSEPELDERLREFFGGMFHRHAQEEGKIRWGEKTPFHTLHMPAMAEIFPDAVFVGILRHPGGAVSSLNQSFHYSVDAAARYWSETNAALIQNGADLGDRFLLCRYEDLVATPEPVTRGLMTWLDEEWTPTLVEHHKAQRERNAPRLVDGGTVAHDAIDPKRAERWLDQLSTNDLALLDDVCGPLAAICGYDIGSPQPTPGRLNPPADAWLISGSSLAQSRDVWQEAAELPPQEFVIPLDATVEDMAARAFKAEAALSRLRTRRAVRLSDSLKRAVRDRSYTDLREAVGVVVSRSR
ncbi:MAG: sulfotransferase [Actinomycetes bacterium]